MRMQCRLCCIRLLEHIRSSQTLYSPMVFIIKGIESLQKNVEPCKSHRASSQCNTRLSIAIEAKITSLYSTSQWGLVCFAISSISWISKMYSTNQESTRKSKYWTYSSIYLYNTPLCKWSNLSRMFCNRPVGEFIVLEKKLHTRRESQRSRDDWINITKFPFTFLFWHFLQCLQWWLGHIGSCILVLLTQKNRHQRIAYDEIRTSLDESKKQHWLKPYNQMNFVYFDTNSTIFWQEMCMYLLCINKSSTEKKKQPKRVLTCFFSFCSIWAHTRAP